MATRYSYVGHDTFLKLVTLEFGECHARVFFNPWQLVAREMNWTYTSHRKISVRQVLKIVEDMEKRGVLEVVRASFRQLAGEARAAPAFASIGYPELLQFIALGRDIANTVGGDSEFCNYLVQKELQAVDLADILGLSGS